MDFHGSAAVSRTILFCFGLWFSCCSAAASGKTWVICISGYNAYRYTYGFEAGVYNICHNLAGKSAENVIIISPDVAAYHVKNSIPGQVVHGESELTEKSRNVYSDITVSYKSQDMTTDLFFAILSGNKRAVKGIGAEKVVESGPQDTIILVFINIGDYGVMTLTNDQYLWAEKFIPFVEDLKEQNKFNKMLILVDGQNAGSMFDGYLCTDCGILAWTNTAKQDDLELCHFNDDVQAFTSTCYTSYLVKHLEYLQAELKRTPSKKITVFDAYQDIRTKTWMFDSISNLYGDLDMGNLALSEFFHLSHK